MTPAQPHPTEETHAVHRPASPSWVDIWAALEVWCLQWLVRWSANPDHAVMDVEGHGGDGGFVLPEHPLLAYRAAAPYLSLAERRAFAHRCCWRVAWMRGACGRFDVHLGRTHGGPKVIFAKWRRLFRVFTDYSRSVRGDRVLPMARLLPALVRQSGCGPPKGAGGCVTGPLRASSGRRPEGDGGWTEGCMCSFVRTRSRSLARRSGPLCTHGALGGRRGGERRVSRS